MAIQVEPVGHDAVGERDRHAGRSPLLVGWLVAIAVLAGSAAWLWATAAVGARPVAPLAGVVVAVAAVFVGDMGARTTTGRRLVAYLSVVALAGLLVVAAALGTFVPWRYGSSIDRLVPVADGWLAQPAGGQPCGPAPSGVAWGGLGAPDEVCTFPSVGGSGEVQLRWGSRELVYLPGNPPRPPSARCFRHLSGPWWEAATTDVACPYRFEFQGGG